MRGPFTYLDLGQRQQVIGWILRDQRRRADRHAYRWRDSEDVWIPVHVQTTPTRFGGEWWWFTCPLVLNGVACNRRDGNLHLPPGAKQFGCRTCHGLTYRNCHETHQSDRLFASIGRVESWLDALKVRQR